MRDPREIWDPRRIIRVNKKEIAELTKQYKEIYWAELKHAQTIDSSSSKANWGLYQFAMGMAWGLQTALELAISQQDMWEIKCEVERDYALQASNAAEVADEIEISKQDDQCQYCGGDLPDGCGCDHLMDEYMDEQMDAKAAKAEQEYWEDEAEAAVVVGDAEEQAHLDLLKEIEGEQADVDPGSKQDRIDQHFVGIKHNGVGIQREMREVNPDWAQIRQLAHANVLIISAVAEIPFEQADNAPPATKEIGDDEWRLIR